MLRPSWSIPKKGFPKPNPNERALAEWRRADLRESEGAARPTVKQIAKVVPQVLKQINLDKKQSDLEILKVWNNLLDPNVTELGADTRVDAADLRRQQWVLVMGRQ